LNETGIERSDAGCWTENVNNTRSFGTEASTNSSLSIGKILVAVNLSEHSEATVTYAAEIALFFQASLTIVYVYRIVPFCEYANETTLTVLEDQRRDLQRMLNVLAQKVQQRGVVCESAFLIGEPTEQISILARDMGADLLVIASHQPQFLERIFNLDKAPPIKHQASCPVLIYHEKAAVEPGTLRNFGIVRGPKQRGNGVHGANSSSD
jgi:nucleotide-binding universal stress UspA family protein